MKKASVIIRAYNEEKHIGGVLERIKNQNFNKDDFEIIVVDSSSTDSTVKIAKKYADKIVTIKPEEFTFGYSLNKGIENSKGEFLVFISAHCYPMHENWLKNLLEPFKDEKIAAVYGKQRGVESSIFSEIQIFNHWYPEEDIPVQEHPFCNNANIAVRKELWKKHKYDETLTGLEDLDWAKKILKNEKKYLSYVSDAGIHHIHEETFRGIYNRYKREGIAYSKIFPEEKFSFSDFLNSLIANTLSDYYFSFNSNALYKNLFSIPRFRFLQFYGSYMGRNFSKAVNHDVMKRFYYPRKPFRKKKWS